MSNILAGVGRGQLKVLEERVAARRAVFARYREALVEVEALQWMPEPEWSYSTHWLTACVIDEQVTSITSRGLIESLAAEMIEARPIWKPMHQQPVFARYPYFNDGKSSVSDRLFRLGLCLPSGSNLSEASFERVVDVLKDVFARA